MHAGDGELEAWLRQELLRLQSCRALAALGLEASASKADIRAAFLAATKRYHPTRFARRGRDIVQLANEVFLRVKDAYQELAGAASGPTAAAGGQGSAGSAPPRRPRTSVNFRAAQSAQRAPRPTPVSSPGIRPPVSSPGIRPPVSSPGIRPPEKGRPVRTTPVSSPSIRLPEKGRPIRTTPVSSPGIRLPEKGQPARTTPVSSPGIRLPASPEQPDRDQAFHRALTMCQRGQWTAARGELEALAARFPRDVQIQAYFHYAQGCELQDLGDTVQARVAYQRALDVVPSFDLARRALAMLARSPGTGAPKPGR